MQSFNNSHVREMPRECLRMVSQSRNYTHSPVVKLITTLTLQDATILEYVCYSSPFISLPSWGHFWFTPKVSFQTSSMDSVSQITLSKTFAQFFNFIFDESKHHTWTLSHIGVRACGWYLNHFSFDTGTNKRS